MLDNHVRQIALACLILVWLLAWTRGGQAERVSVSVLGVNWIVSMAIAGLVRQNPPLHELVELASDLILAVAFLIVAIVYSSRWLGVAMFIQATGLAIHADMFRSMSAGEWWIHQAGVNVTGFGVLWCVAGATGATWWKRRRLAKAKAANAAQPPAVPNPA